MNPELSCQSDALDSDLGADSTLGVASSAIIANLVREKKVLLGEVATLRQQSKEVSKVLRKQPTCASHNAGIEDKIRLVNCDMEQLAARKTALEAEIAALKTRLGGAQRYLMHEKEKRSEEDMGEKRERMSTLYERLLQFRLENEIFDEEFPSPETLKSSLRECVEFSKEVKNLRKQLTKKSINDLSTPQERHLYRETLRSYTELMLQYHEVQLRRVKLATSRLQHASK